MRLERLGWWARVGSIGVSVWLVVGGCAEVEDGATTFATGASAAPMSAGTDAGSEDGSGSAGTEGTGEGGGTGPATASEDTAGNAEDDGSGTGLAETCGNGQIDPGEACDGAAVGDDTCQAHGYGGGVLMCTPDCAAVDLAGCDMAAACGNGMVDAGEQCDGNDLGGSNCAALGFDMGVVACTATCTYDTSGCSNVMCAAMFEDCTSLPCCAGLLCYPIEGNYCGPMP